MFLYGNLCNILLQPVQRFLTLFICLFVCFFIVYAFKLCTYICTCNVRVCVCVCTHTHIHTYTRTYFHTRTHIKCRYVRIYVGRAITAWIAKSPGAALSPLTKRPISQELIDRVCSVHVSVCLPVCLSGMRVFLSTFLSACLSTILVFLCLSVSHACPGCPCVCLPACACLSGSLRPEVFNIKSIIHRHVRPSTFPCLDIWVYVSRSCVSSYMAF
jgi:hypothetical protein